MSLGRLGFKDNKLCVYVISNSSFNIYNGMTNNFQRRRKQHNGKLPGGANYTKTKGGVWYPLFLIQKQITKSKISSISQNLGDKPTSFERKVEFAIKNSPYKKYSKERIDNQCKNWMLKAFLMRKKEGLPLWTPTERKRWYNKFSLKAKKESKIRKKLHQLHHLVHMPNIKYVPIKIYQTCSLSDCDINQEVNSLIWPKWVKLIKLK